MFSGSLLFEARKGRNHSEKRLFDKLTLSTIKANAINDNIELPKQESNNEDFKLLKQKVQNKDELMDLPEDKHYFNQKFYDERQQQMKKKNSVFVSDKYARNYTPQKGLTFDYNQGNSSRKYSMNNYAPTLKVQFSQNKIQNNLSLKHIPNNQNVANTINL